MQQWHPNIHITTALAKTIIEQQFTSLAPISSIRTAGKGWDNHAFIVNDHLIFRFPHRQVAVALIEQENNVLKYLHNTFELNIPHPIYIGKPSTHYPYLFHGYHIVNGISGCQAKLTSKQRAASLPTLAKFLKQLHSITAAEARAIGAKAQVFDRTSDKTISELLTRIDKIVSRKICIINQQELTTEISVAQQTQLAKNDHVLLHGDLYCRHLMFDKQGRLNGIIDWGDMGINNRSVDLAVVFSFYPSNCHPSFLEIYGDVEPQTWQYARFLGLYSAFTLLLYGHDTGDTTLTNEAINAINRINHRLIISNTKHNF